MCNLNYVENEFNKETKKRYRLQYTTKLKKNDNNSPPPPPPKYHPIICAI